MNRMEPIRGSAEAIRRNQFVSFLLAKAAGKTVRIGAAGEKCRGCSSGVGIKGRVNKR